MVMMKDFKLIKLQGKELSYNNYNDIFACLNLTKKHYQKIEEQ